MNKYITISDIAREAGVTKSTVSFVLNDKEGRVPISAATRERVMKIVKAHNYQPNPMSRSLKTKRTGNLGFFLSDDMAGGFANMFFSSIMNGVEAHCREIGYGLSIGLFNLSCIDSFIFPTPMRQHCVDGVVLAGFVADEILDKFAENSIKCVCIGDYMSHPERICTVACDVTDCTLSLARHLAALGHKRIGMQYPTKERDIVEVEKVRKAFAGIPELRDTKPIFMLTPNHSGNYGAAAQLFNDYMAMPISERPTAIICTDQTAFALLGEFSANGMRCPDDISIAATSDTGLCQWGNPGITSFRFNLDAIGRYAAKLLIDNVVSNNQLSFEQSKKDFHGELIVRKSTGAPRK